MKRFITLLLILILASSCSLSFAESDARPILFRGIPWGISYHDLRKLTDLTALETYEPVSGHSSTLTVASLIAGAAAIGDAADDKTYNGKYYVDVADYTGDAIRTIGDIAGYQLLDIHLYFARIPDDSGVVTQDEERTALFGAVYSLFGPPIDPDISKTNDEIKEDLTAKLSSLYGEPEVIDGDPTWHGPEGTLSSLRFNLNRDYKYIIYASEAGDEWLKACLDAETAAEEAAQAAKEAEFSSRTNGL